MREVGREEEREREEGRERKEGEGEEECSTAHMTCSTGLIVLPSVWSC